jgi:hypothetical protein
MDGWEREGGRTEGTNQSSVSEPKKRYQAGREPEYYCNFCRVIPSAILNYFLKDARFLLYEFWYGFSNRI